MVLKSIIFTGASRQSDAEYKQRSLPSRESHDIVLEAEDNFGMLEVTQVYLIQEDAPGLHFPRK